ncbi:hypothetical protein L1080_031080 [Rhodococcus sp. MSC1_016]|uniref:hypothetical protein n=1 Tax=Rhodococcus sp. MSC1_016 TaxID=2909266 RepID=UPI0020303A34|nr:hypothetical protein [Rhodococcus sp. MSC1_016]
MLLRGATGLTVSALAARTGLAARTTNRIVQALVPGAFGIQAPRRRPTDDLVRPIMPPMRGVAARIGAGGGTTFLAFR